MAARLPSILEFWKNFDLSELQKELDTTATDLAAKQDQSDVSRKQLVEQSRDFKKNTPEDVRKIVAPLLKSFQSEIDSLSKRSKNAEACFLALYKRLIDLPDPVPWLDSAVGYQKRAQRADDVEVENRKLRDTLDEYNHEFAEVKNQEVTIKQLREKLKEAEEKTEASAQLKAKEKERELVRQFAEKERQLQESQLSVAKQLGEAEHRVSTLQSALDAIQGESFELRTKYEEVTAAKADEMDMIMADLERANERANSAERQVEQLRRQLVSSEGRGGGEGGVSDVTGTGAMLGETRGTSRDMEQAIDILKRSSLEVELAAKEKEISQLVHDVQKLQVSLSKLRESSASQIARLEEDLAIKSHTLHRLEERLRTQADYEELKRELSIMKSIEFSSGSGGNGCNPGGVEGGGKTLEVLLLEKNKALQAENTTLKVNSANLTEQCTRLEEQQRSLLGMVQEQKLLISQLEEDLRSVNALSSMFRGDAEGEAGPPSHSAELVADAVKGIEQTSAVMTPLSSGGHSAADSLLPIVQSQRERFRLRAQDLEAQTVSQQQQLQMLQNETDKLRSDNLKLYERIKFLQSYPSKAASSSVDVESRYSSQYEEKLDPFSKFSRQERARRYMNLKPYDKITLSMGKMIMGNKMLRVGVFFYTIILHVLVFLALYKVAYTTEINRDFSAECQHQFAQHMHDVHGQEVEVAHAPPDNQ